MKTPKLGFLIAIAITGLFVIASVGAISINAQTGEFSTPRAVLTSGVPYTSSLSGTGYTQTHTIAVTSGATLMYSVLTCGSADFDLYGRLNAAPTTSVYNWRGYTSGGEEVSFSNPGAGTWYIMVRSYSGSGSYTLTVTITYSTPPTYPTLTSGVPATGSLSATGATYTYKMTVGSGCTQMYSVLTCGSADFDLYGRYNAVPTTSTYNWRGYTSGGEEVTYANPTAGTWYIMVRSYSGSGAYTLTVTLSYSSGDTTAPTVSITSPASGATVSGTTTISASASDNVGVTKVEFYIDGSLKGTDTTSPYSYSWVTTGYSDGSHTIYAKAYDAAGNVGTTATRTVTVNNGGGGGGAKYAIIVGISDYAYISDLSYCDEDATDWYNKLNPMGYSCKVYGDGHTSNYPRHDGTATESTVRAAIQQLATVAVSGDTVCFITSGHGSGTGTGSSYLCMYDCSGSAGCYYDTEIKADFDNFALGVKIFIFIDHCYSGGIGPELMAMPNSAYVFCTTTCTANGYGYDDSSHQNGAWTYYYLQHTWINYYGGSSSIAHETIFSYADNVYPYTGGDNPMKFDGNTASSFYL
ncbi:MAG: caspase family protein [Candidatus Heimdallarchaeota archaeon]|nr:caspase family protein [Candidatus Heimdallarchaeota archaeon]